MEKTKRSEPIYVSSLVEPTLFHLKELRNILFAFDPISFEAHDLKNQVTYQVRDRKRAYQVKYDPIKTDPLLLNENLWKEERYQSLFFHTSVDQTKLFCLTPFLEEEFDSLEELLQLEDSELLDRILWYQKEKEWKHLLNTTLKFELTEAEKIAGIQKRFRK